MGLGAIKREEVLLLSFHFPAFYSIFYYLLLFPFSISYLLHLFSFFSITSHSIRILPLCFQAGCCRRRLNLALGFRSTLRQSQPNKAGRKCPSARTYVRVYVLPSTESFFDFNEIWLVGRDRWVMHDSMQYDPIQGQGHEPFKVGNPAVFKSYLLRHLQWELATDHEILNKGTMSKLIRPDFWYSA